MGFPVGSQHGLGWWGLRGTAPLRKGFSLLISDNNQPPKRCKCRRTSFGNRYASSAIFKVPNN